MRCGMEGGKARRGEAEGGEERQCEARRSLTQAGRFFSGAGPCIPHPSQSPVFVNSGRPVLFRGRPVHTPSQPKSKV